MLTKAGWDWSTWTVDIPLEGWPTSENGTTVCSLAKSAPAVPVARPRRTGAMSVCFDLVDRVSSGKAVPVLESQIETQASVCGTVRQDVRLDEPFHIGAIASRTHVERR